MLRKSILICDDLVDNCIILQVILEMEGYKVECATSGREAINQIQLHKPDLLLLDVMMPELNGFEVVKIIRQDQHLQYLPILLITAYKQMIVPKLTHINVNRVIHKPVDSDDLVDIVHEVLQT
ncbi:response regulator [Calothrix sp. NIES-2098]|uniref:response regulator n=1 Tax=Calothrix sp. NIES-2098 TaxID=1954171 RepID=UPI000B5E4932|nr:response regulator receiver sensor signal transduction histidine kinase [Calothrix sp. NIES-2098]